MPDIELSPNVKETTVPLLMMVVQVFVGVGLLHPPVTPGVVAEAVWKDIPGSFVDSVTVPLVRFGFLLSNWSESARVSPLLKLAVEQSIFSVCGLVPGLVLQLNCVELVISLRVAPEILTVPVGEGITTFAVRKLAAATVVTRLTTRINGTSILRLIRRLFSTTGDSGMSPQALTSLFKQW